VVRALNALVNLFCTPYIFALLSALTFELWGRSEAEVPHERLVIRICLHKVINGNQDYGHNHLHSKNQSQTPTLI
jgi:hypothetical protein